MVEFRELLDGGSDPDELIGQVDRPCAKNLDAVPAAVRFIDESTMWTIPGDKFSRLKFYRGEFYLWHAGLTRYGALSGDMVKAQLVRHIDSYAHHITATVIGNVMLGVKAETIVNDSTEMPAWIGIDPQKPPKFPAAELLSMKNGLLHIPTLADGGADCLVEKTPRFFSANSLNFDFEPNAGEPTEWIKFLNQLWPDDPQSIETLQDWIGYLLTNDTRQQKMLVIVGPKRSGKGTISRIIRALIGPENVPGPTLAGLGTNFGLWPLIGKPVAIISDARLSGRTDSAVVTERLLSITGEDAMTIDRKCLQPVTTKLPTRIIILTNELPRFGDSSGALVGRMIVLRMTKSFYGREDQDLTDRLLS
ncbi:MAG: hypothetical protein EXS05_16660 [Planctomycetaceae bacterium]|nr:hypothetical protein [Planctomycetaceae bacterium]